jgi:hypothetical protein
VEVKAFGQKGSPKCALIYTHLGACRKAWKFLRSVRLAVDQRPLFEGTPVPGLPIGVFGFQGEAGFSVKRKDAGTVVGFFDLGVLRARGCARETERLLSIAAILPPIRRFG